MLTPHTLRLQERRIDEEPLPVGVKPEVAELVSRSSLAFTNFYYPDSASLPGICTTCVAGRCEVNALYLVHKVKGVSGILLTEDTGSVFLRGIENAEWT